MPNTAAKKRVGQADVDFDYPFANLPSALVEPLPRVSVLRSYFNPSLSGWTSGVAPRILEGPCPNSGLSLHGYENSMKAVSERREVEPADDYFEKYPCRPVRECHSALTAPSAISIPLRLWERIREV
jgi:hypothetical protein